MATRDTQSRKWGLMTKKNLLELQKRKRRASSASVIWHVVSFGVRPVYPKLRKEGTGRNALLNVDN
jgi:hypothetical protein